MAETVTVTAVYVTRTFIVGLTQCKQNVDFTLIPSMNTTSYNDSQYFFIQTVYS